MDFKSLISKIESIDGRVETPKAPELPKTVQLNEDAQLRVLAGTSTYVSEAKKKAEEDKKEEKVKEGQEDLKKVGDKVKTSKGVMTKTATGLKHERSYTKDKDEDDEDAPKAKKAKKESIDPEKFKSKFSKMVEAKKTMKDEKKAKKEKMAEGSKPDFLDMDKDGDKKEPMKKAVADKGGDKKDGKKGMSAAQEKYFGKKNESVKTSKKVVAESVELKLSFKDMVRLVQESGGQQQIDPVDKALFTWASRVASNKLGEGMKAELYAGLIYERNGGTFEMYDVLSESKKNLSESYQLDEGMMDKIKSLIPKFMKFIGAEKAEAIANKVKEITGGDLSANPENAEKVAQAFGFDKIVKDKAMSKEDIMGEGIAGNWQGKLVQFLYLAGLGGAAAGAASMWGTVGGSFMAIIGTLLIMFAATFFSDESGMVGSMGKYGNKGFDTKKGSDTQPGKRDIIDLGKGHAGPLD
jgi:hypothetical protein